MEKWQSSQLEVLFNVEGQEALKKVSVNNLIEEPTEEGLLSFGKVLAQLSPEDQQLNHSLLVTRTLISE